MATSLFSLWFLFCTCVLPSAIFVAALAPLNPALVAQVGRSSNTLMTGSFTVLNSKRATLKDDTTPSADSQDHARRMISLSELLSSCINASRLGCQVIRQYKQDHATITGTLKEEGEVKSVVTQADFDTQAVIVQGLRQLWGDDLTIVGEEDDDDDDDNNSDNNNNNNAGSVPNSQNDKDTPSPLRTNLLDGIVSTTTKVPMEELTLFIDPLDGTREFVEGRVQNVGCLIGVARNGKAIMGAVGLPFPQGLNSSNARVQWAMDMDDDVAQLSHHGMYPIVQEDGNVATQDNTLVDASTAPITIFTGDSKDPVLRNATQLALELAHTPGRDPPLRVLLGGTTSKFVAVANQQPSMAVLHFKTCYWDTCASEPLLNALGGKVTDLFGSPLVHLPDTTYNFGNLWGVVASSKGLEKVHDQLCAQMRADRDSVQTSMQRVMGTIPSSCTGSQAVDIARDLDGHPLTREWLQDHILDHQSPKNRDWKLNGYGVPESHAVRGLMSNGARLVLEWESTNSNDNTQSPPPSSVFYKRIVMSDLLHTRAKLATAPHKIVRDVRSYQIESGFLDSRACREGLIEEAGVQVCQCFGASQRAAPTGSSPRVMLESKFAMTLEDFKHEDGWYQEWLLEEESAKAALKTFANMHAYFWTGSNFWKKEGGKWGKELEATVWNNGGYMQPALQGYEQYQKVASGWTQRLASFEDELSQIDELKGVDLKEIGARMERMAEEVGTRAHPFTERAQPQTTDMLQYRTLIHGDPKQSNIFFRKGDDIEVGLIDFQWCGFGLAATDVAHHICAALQPHCLSYDGQKEKALLDHYYTCLTQALIQHGVASSSEQVQNSVFPRTVLQEQYEVAFLDLSRMVFAYAWSRWKPESEPSAESFNRNAYNKSLPSVLWFVTRGAAILDSRDVQARST